MIGASDWVDLAVGLVWPVVVLAIVVMLYPTAKRVMESRGFTVKVGSAEITVQQASDQLADRLDDVREQVAALKERVDAGGETPGVAPKTVDPLPDTAPRRILWVDDHPENNAYEMAALQAKGVTVIGARSTAEAMVQIGSNDDFGAVITDMGRVEDGKAEPDAGLRLIELVRSSAAETPVIVYASAPALARTRDRALAAGATAATSSATELMQLLAQREIV